MLSEYIAKKKEEFKQARHVRAVRMSEEMYQVREYDGELWFTFNSNLVCPVSMLKDDAIAALERMRNAYVERMY